MNGKAALALILRPAGGKSSGGGGDAVAEKEDAKESKDDGADPKKLRLGAAKDILDAETAEELDSALYEYVCAVIRQESSEGEEE